MAIFGQFSYWGFRKSGDPGNRAGQGKGPTGRGPMSWPDVTYPSICMDVTSDWQENWQTDWADNTPRLRQKRPLAMGYTVV